MSTPTLSGAERGKVQPYRKVPDGLYLLDGDTGALRNVQCALRLVGERRLSAFRGYVQQYLSKKGTGEYDDTTFGREVTLLMLHWALVPPEARAGQPVQPIFPLPHDFTDPRGVVNAGAMDALALRDLADGEMSRLAQEYDLLIKTQLPPFVSHEVWQKIVNEGKDCSLRTLRLQHGSSALIQVLHGMGDLPWPA